MRILCKNAWYGASSDLFPAFTGLAKNITAFLMAQNQQFEDAINALTHAKQSLDPARYAACVLQQPQLSQILFVQTPEP